MTDQPKKFEGFPDVTGNFTQVPNVAFKIMHELSGAEYKCLMYIIRHTYGFDEPIKAITLDEFQNGRKRRDGTRMDNGTGLSKQAVISALKHLLDTGYLIVEKDDRDKARKERAYGVNRMSKNLTSDVQKLDIGGQETRHRTEKETIETNHRNTVAPSGSTPELPTTVENLPTEPTSRTAAQRAAWDTLWEKQPRMYETPADVTTRTAALRDYGNRMAEHIEALPPVSIDDFGKTDPAEGYAVTPPPPRTEPLEEVKTALAELFGWKHEGVLQNYGRMLRGIKSKRKTAYDEYAFVGQPVSADELRAWVASWKRAHPGLDLPQTPDAMARHISAYRAAVTNTAPGGSDDPFSGFTIE